MRIKALEDWEYVPEFGGNRAEEPGAQTVYKFRVLSGKEDLALRKEGKEFFPDSLESVIVSVKNPPILVDKAGKEHSTNVLELGSKAELKGLYMELIVEYGNHSTLGAVAGKP